MRNGLLIDEVDHRTVHAPDDSAHMGDFAMLDIVSFGYQTTAQIRRQLRSHPLFCLPCKAVLIDI